MTPNTPPPADPAEAMRDEDIGPTAADVIVESLPPAPTYTAMGIHAVQRHIVDRLTAASFEIRRRDAAAGSVCVSRALAKRVWHAATAGVELAPEGWDIATYRDAFQKNVDEFRAALGDQP